MGIKIKSSLDENGFAVVKVSMVILSEKQQ